MVGGEAPTFFWKVSRPPEAAQTPKIEDLKPAKKSSMKKLRFKIL